MHIIKNELHVGAERPFTVLHMTDTHLTCTDAQDSEARRQLARDRRRMCPDAEEELAFVREHVAQTGATLVHTGDLVDFLTPENLRVAERFAKDTGLWMVAGNHEIHRCPNNVFCEVDFTEDLRCQEDILGGVQSHFHNDIRFFCHTIHGVSLVGIYDGDYQIRADQLAALKEIVAQGRPILLFMHIPLFCEELLTVRSDCMLATPQDIVDTYPPLPSVRAGRQRNDASGVGVHHGAGSDRVRDLRSHPRQLRNYRPALEKAAHHRARDASGDRNLVI